MIRLDPGWLFVVAGLALVLAAAVIPSGRERQALEMQLGELRRQETANYGVLGAYARFAQDLDDRDPALLRRLAAAQLNMIPRGETPLLMASTVNASVPEWVESTVVIPAYEQEPVPDTLLSRWTQGSRRLWAIGAGAFLVFVGLLLSPIPIRREEEMAIEGESEEVGEASAIELESADEVELESDLVLDAPREMTRAEEEAERIGSPSE